MRVIERKELIKDAGTHEYEDTSIPALELEYNKRAKKSNLKAKSQESYIKTVLSKEASKRKRT